MIHFSIRDPSWWFIFIKAILLFRNKITYLPPWWRIWLECKSLWSSLWCSYEWSLRMNQIVGSVAHPNRSHSKRYTYINKPTTPHTARLLAQCSGWSWHIPCWSQSRPQIPWWNHFWAKYHLQINNIIDSSWYNGDKMFRPGTVCRRH